MDDIVLIDKPKGITSFDVIRQLRRKLNIKKMGHSGTLDPAATGLMIIGINKGTKKLNDLIKLDKVYETEILLGIQTDSGDLDGKVLEEKEIIEELKDQDIQKVLDSITGEIELYVPIYSAIKRGGEALYKKARRGEKVEPPKKMMKIYWVKLINHHKEDKKYIIELEIKVASGTYIRSIAEEIGKRLGYPAVVKELRRTKIGEFDVKDAEKL